MLLLVAWACSTPEPPPPPPIPEGASTVPTLLGEVAGVAFVGDWTSGPCSGRSYARNVHFDSDQHFAVVDIVDPCEPGTECVWSGLTTFSGLWAVDGTRLKVREIGAVAATPGGPHPVLFESTTDGKLVENGCTYEKGLTVPEGYTAERVRPVVPK